MPFDDSKGQGGAEYLLLFGAVIIIAVASLLMYNSYFGHYSNDTMDVTLDITSINTPYALKATYEADKNGKVISGGPKSYFYLNKGQTKTVNLGKFSSGDTLSILVGVGNPDKEPQDLVGSDWTGKNRWVSVKLTIGKEVTSWTVAGPYNWHSNPSGGVIRSFTIPNSNIGINSSADSSNVRNSL